MPVREAARGSYRIRSISERRSGLTGAGTGIGTAELPLLVLLQWFSQSHSIDANDTALSGA